MTEAECFLEKHGQLVFDIVMNELGRMMKLPLPGGLVGLLRQILGKRPLGMGDSYWDRRQALMDCALAIESLLEGGK